MLNRREFGTLVAAGGALAGAPAVAANTGDVRFIKMASKNVPGEVEVAIYMPPDESRRISGSLPLVLMLHGGNGSAQDLVYFTKFIDQEIVAGRLTPMAVVMPSARRSLYMDYRDGSQRWERFIVADLLPHLRRTLDVSSVRDRTFITGVSMGGLGALRTAFKHPDLFGAVAALEPAIEPALFWHEIGPQVRFWRSEDILRPIFGDPIDTRYWEDNNPATIASRQPERLLDLSIYLEVGDQDMLYLYEGVEFLHRILFEARLAHEYRLVHGAEHVGPSLGPRFIDALGFLQREILPPPWINSDVMKVRAVMDRQKRAIGLDVEPVDPRRIKAN